MAVNHYPLQLGGNPIENDDKGWYQFPATLMVPESCADRIGAPAQQWHAPTTGHRGHGSFANSRILDFTDPKTSVYCRPNCLVDKPWVCDDEDMCPRFYKGVEGWPNQVGVWDYYCRVMRDSLQAGDCIHTHLVPAQEKFDSFTWGVARPAEGVTGKFKLLCADVDLTPVIDFGVQGRKYECVKIEPENQFADLCDGYDVVVLELETVPDAVLSEDCKEESGKLDGLSFMAAVRTEAVCTGK